MINLLRCRFSTGSSSMQDTKSCAAVESSQLTQPQSGDQISKLSKWHTSHGYNHPVFLVNDFVLPLSDTVRHLGVMVDSDLKLDKHVATVYKAHTRANLILQCFTSRDRKLLVKAFCFPLLEYCTPMLSIHYRYLIDKIKRVQRRFTKRLSGLHHLSYCNRLQVLGIQSLGAIGL